MDKNSTDRMVTKEKTIKVVFRKFENGEIIGLFPEIP